MNFLNAELQKRGYDDRWAGTRYLREAVRVTLTYPAARGVRVTKELYPAVAKAAAVNAGQVERSIRYAVHKAEPGRTVSGVVHEIAAVVRGYED